MQHRDKITLNKIAEEANIAIKMLSGVKQEDFIADEVLKRAVAMTVINIGELVKNLSMEFRNEYKSVPWKAISGFRDVAAHKYGTLDMSIVYNTVKIDIPSLGRRELNLHWFHTSNFPCNGSKSLENTTVFPA